MFLKKLEMQGFKSFAERTRLELGRGITAIVGPNGSGKSNISDSIRWVLGEQSARSLRGDTMQDVIFAGSDGKGPLGMASVSLTLGDCMGYLSLDFDEVTVSRRVYRSGESQYLINKSPCRLRDIRDLFLDTGLGREGYYLIEQGQIDAILHARAEERRMIIEQAAGIGKYRVRKNEARKKLIDTEAKLIRLEDILNELNRQLQPLGKAATKAKMYLNLTQEYASKGQAVCAYEWTGLAKESQQLQERKSQLLTSLATLEKEQRQEEATIAALRQEMEKLEIHVERLQELRTRSIEAMGEIQQQQTMAKERLKHIEADGNRLKEQLVEYGNRRKEVRKELAACLWHLRSIRRRRAEEARRMEELVRTQTHQQSQRQKLLEEREKIGVTQESLRHTMAEVQAELEASLSRKALWQEQIAVLSHRLEEIRGQNEAIGEELLRQETALSQARQELASGHSSLAVHRQSHVELQSRWSSHQDLVNSWQEKLRTQTSRFQALVAMEKDYVGYYRGVRAVMQARERLSGICGTVAELIQVPRDLEIAIEIALGSSLQNIVTETDVGARQAVSYLKEKQAGRATFLPLDGLRPTQFGSRERALLERDGVVGLASDLIGYDPRHEAMVQYLLGRVVVTKDLDTAVALSRNLHSYGRIVTVDGDTISPGGAITGGSIPQKEKNGLLQRRQQVSRLAKAIQASEAALKKEQEKAKSLTEDLRQSDLQIKTLAEQLHQTELDIKELEKEVALGRNEKTRWEREEGQVTDEISRLEERLATEIEKRQERLVRLEHLELEVEEWQQKFLALQAELDILEKDEVDIRQNCTASQVGIAALESEIQADEREVARHRRILHELINSVDGIKEAQKTVELQKAALQRDSNRLAEEYLRLQADSRHIEEEAVLQAKRRKEIQNELKAKEQAGKVRHHATNQLQKELADLARASDKVELKKAGLLETMKDEYDLEPNDVADLSLLGEDIKETRERIRVLKEEIRALGPVDTDAIAQYEAVRERYSYLQCQQEDLIDAREQLTQVIDEMDKVSNARFHETLTQVQTEFQSIFAKLFGGGRAELVLMDADELEEAGLDISVRPPGKKPQNINLLSGGERALTAMSLLFALLRVKPSPFCVLDEIDASLDESNLERFAQLLKDFARYTQFIVITHRPTTMEVADTLYGVTMNEAHISQLVGVQLDEAAAGFEGTASEVG